MESYFFDGSFIGNDPVTGVPRFDREYLSDEFANDRRGFFSDGVVESPDRDALKVSVTGAAPSLVLSVAPGRVIVKGYQGICDGTDEFPLSSLPDGFYRVVVRWDKSEMVRAFNCLLIPGTSTTLPELVRTANVHDMCLANVEIVSGAPTVEDTRRDPAVCGAMRFRGHSPLPPYYPPLEVERYDVPGAYEWVVPDLYGDGMPYEVSGVAIGGGGSGGVAVRRTISNVANQNMGYATATGGAAGYVKTWRMIVTPGEVKPVVVGNGGGRRTGASAGMAGGSSSFDGIVANGGSGGASNSNNTSISSTSALGGAYGGQMSSAMPMYSGGNSSGQVFGNAPWGGFLGMFNTSNYISYVTENLFSPGQLYTGVDFSLLSLLGPILGAGGGATSSTSWSSASSCSRYWGYQNAPEFTPGQKGGNGAAACQGNTDTAVTVSATDAIGIGNGGGAAAFSRHATTNNGTVDINSGAGAPGAVVIFARRLA